MFMIIALGAMAAATPRVLVVHVGKTCGSSVPNFLRLNANISYDLKRCWVPR